MKNIIEILNNDGVGVLPTDTLYGISGRALDKKAVERIKKIKKRSKKPFIVLINSVSDLEKFGIKPDKFMLDIFKRCWPQKITIILDCKSEKFDYLHLGKKTLAFRLPDKKDLREILKKTGPLISTSANPEGKSPALTIKEARAYFGDSVDFYSDEGKLDSLPSALVRIENREIIVLRKGEIKIN
jgi:L-threonylcarbamoyladenylate synthase